MKMAEKNNFFPSLDIKILSAAFSDLGKNIELVIAVSGGMDSMLLANGLIDAWHAGQLALKSITLLHFNHSLRGKESDEDARFVEDFAEKNNLPLRMVNFSWSENENKSQDACRKKRAEELTNPFYADKWLVLGHHLNDQAETFIFRVLRGTGRNGLACMLPIDISKKRIRPYLLLKKSRSDIESLALQNGLNYRDDSSNASGKYARNRIRQKIIPELIKESSVALQNISHLCEQFQKSKVEKCIPFYEDEYLSLFAPNQASNSADQLAISFGLNRQQTKQLLLVLSKDVGSVRINASKVLHWGQGVLLLEKRSLSVKRKPSNSQVTALGLFTVLDKNENVQLAFGSKELILGDKVKKGFQKMRIPAALRSEVPLIHWNGKTVPVLPPTFSKESKFLLANLNFEFKPSKLAVALGAVIHNS